MKEQVKQLLDKKKWKGKELMVVLVLVGIILAVLAIPVDKTNETENVQDISVQAENMQNGRAAYEEELEERLETILTQMEGVGRVEVMITLESSAREVIEKDYATQQEQSSDEVSLTGQTSVSKEENTVYADTDVGNVPYVVQEIYPEVEGVLVVAEGGDDSYVNLAIVDAIQALFGIDVHKIKIVKMNTN